MRYLDVIDYSEPQFLRLTGVKRSVFGLMVEVVCGAYREFGRPRKLSVEDQVLLTLCYFREYRSQFRLASSFGVSEARVCRTVKTVERALLGTSVFICRARKRCIRVG